MTESISTETQTSPAAEYEPLKVDFTPTPAVVPLVAWTWNTPVIPQFYWNVYSAEQRIKQICLEIGRIQEYLNYFATHYNKMSGYLNKRIDKLTAAMYAEVERLDKAIEEENKARKLADELLQKGLDAEIARAKAAEIVLQQNIDANTTLIEDEEKRAKDAEEKLTTDLHDETAARVAEDKKINDTVETNRQHAEEVDAQLFDSIRTESNLRKNADNVLSDRIDKETEERKASDTNINARIDDEHTERVKSDNYLGMRVGDNKQAIEHEVERAKSTENNLNDALEREIDARVDTDRSLENTIDANDRTSKERDNKLQGNIDANDTASKDRDTQLQANIDAEIANRGNAENAINDRITNEVNERKADNTSINTRIDKEAEERKNDVTSLATRVDTEQTERVKADNAFDKRVTDNTQAIEHETERAKSAETNLNDALEREVDARQDDTRNLENLIDKANNDSQNRDDSLQNIIENNKNVVKTYIDSNDSLIKDSISKLNNNKLAANNIKSAENSHINVSITNENTENATVTIGDTFDTDFKKVGDDIEAEKQRAIAKENELSGKVEHETQERQTETTSLNNEVAKRPTLDKFIAGENITLTPDADKTTLKIDANNSVEKLLTDEVLNEDEKDNFIRQLFYMLRTKGDINIERYLDNDGNALRLTVPPIDELLTSGLYIDISKSTEETDKRSYISVDLPELFKNLQPELERRYALYSPDNSIEISASHPTGVYTNLAVNIKDERTPLGKKLVDIEKELDSKLAAASITAGDGIAIQPDTTGKSVVIKVTKDPSVKLLHINASSRIKEEGKIFIPAKELGINGKIINAKYKYKNNDNSENSDSPFIDYYNNITIPAKRNVKELVINVLYLNGEYKSDSLTL